MYLKIFHIVSSETTSKVLKILFSIFHPYIKNRVVGIEAKAWHQLVGTS